MVAVDLWFRFIDVVLGAFGCGLLVGLLGWCWLGLCILVLWF